jgi:hypothetical protein
MSQRQGNTRHIDISHFLRGNVQLKQTQLSELMHRPIQWILEIFTDSVSQRVMLRYAAPGGSTVVSYEVEGISVAVVCLCSYACVSL